MDVDFANLQKYNKVLQLQLSFTKLERDALLKVIHKHNLYNEYIKSFDESRRNDNKN
jgi:hypothetical protein